MFPSPLSSASSYAKTLEAPFNPVQLRSTPLVGGLMWVWTRALCATGGAVYVAAVVCARASCLGAKGRRGCSTDYMYMSTPALVPGD